MRERRTVLLVYFLLGAFCVCAQATLLRETQVVLFGSELSWGLVLACWLAGVALGARASTWFPSSTRGSVALLATANLALPLVLAAAVVLLRGSRVVLGTGAGEYIGPLGMLCLAAVTTIPVSSWIGLAFPAAANIIGGSQTESTERARSVGFVYLAEASGSLAGGALFSFVLVTVFDAFSLVFGGCAILAAATAWLCHRLHPSKPMEIAAAAVAIVAAGVILAGGASTIEHKTILMRWRSFAPGLELVVSENSRYQNIAIGRLAEQKSIYANGRVAATWPDHSTLAIEAHLAACQHPAPRRMLVLGGGVEGILKELLRHGPERLDYVTLDGLEQEIIAPLLDDADRAALEDPRVHVHLADARRFVKQIAHAETAGYDLIIIAAPEPSSALLARLYTKEFFAELYRLSSADGVVALSLSGSVGVWSAAAAEYVGSVVAALQQAFPDVLLTFSDPVRIFAAGREGVIASSGRILADRYRSRNVESPFFSPVWFAGASELLDADKRQLVLRALSDNQPRYHNSDDRPVAAVYNLRLWQSTTGPSHRGEFTPGDRGARLVSALLDMKLWWVIGAIGVCALLVLGAGWFRAGSGMRQIALLSSVGSTGFAVMAIEIVLLYTFQVLYGYVYGMVGLVIGIFMAGLVLGGWAMNAHLRDGSVAMSRKPVVANRAESPGLKTVLTLDVILALFAAALLPLLAVLRRLPADGFVQLTVFCLVAAAGLVGGLLFPLAAFVRLQDQPGTARAAAAIDAADHMGGSVGALVTGVVLVPVLGVAGTCAVLAILKLLSGVLVAVGVVRGGGGLSVTAHEA